MGWLRMMGVWSFIRLNPRWEVRLLRTPDNIRKLKLKCVGNEADWTWAEALYEHGGFSFGTDTIFIKPVPEEWLDADMCCCPDGEKVWHGTLGSAPKTSFMQRYVDACRAHQTPHDGYQAYGTDMINGLLGSMGGLSTLGNELKISRMSLDAMTPIRWSAPQKLWEGEEPKFPEDTFAVTWYGNAPCSKEREYEVPHKHADARIVRLAMTHMEP